MHIFVYTYMYGSLADQTALDCSLRTGQPGRAKLLALDAGLPPPPSLAAFERGAAMQDALRGGNMGPVLAWVHQHREKLLGLGPTSEVCRLLCVLCVCVLCVCVDVDVDVDEDVDVDVEVCIYVCIFVCTGYNML